MSRRKQWKLLDKFKRKIFLKQEVKKKFLTSCIHASHISFMYRYYALFNRSKVIKFSNIIVQNNRCIVTGRNWNVNKFTQYSRFVLRRKAYNGYLPGFKRASW